MQIVFHFQDSVLCGCFPLKHFFHALVIVHLASVVDNVQPECDIAVNVQIVHRSCTVDLQQRSKVDKDNIARG